MKIDIDMSELTALGRQLAEEAPEQARAAARGATQQEGRAVKSRAQAGAPRDTGRLATQGIRMKSFNNPDNVATNVFTTPDSEGRDVGFYQEYGTSRNPPVGFMQAAIAPAEQSYPAAILAAINPLERPGSGGGGGDE